MKKTITSILVVFAMLISICPAAMADPDVANTVLLPTGDFFTSGGAANPLPSEDVLQQQKHL